MLKKFLRFMSIPAIIAIIAFIIFLVKQEYDYKSVDLGEGLLIPSKTSISYYNSDKHKIQWQAKIEAGFDIDEKSIETTEYENFSFMASNQNSFKRYEIDFLDGKFSSDKIKKNEYNNRNDDVDDVGHAYYLIEPSSHTETWNGICDSDVKYTYEGTVYDEGWRFNTSAPIISEQNDDCTDSVYLFCSDGMIYSVDPTEKKENWHMNMNTPFFFTPKIVYNRIFVYTHKKILVFNSFTGKKVQELNIKHSIKYQPEYLSDNIIFISKDNYLCYIDIDIDINACKAFINKQVSIKIDNVVDFSPTYDKNDDYGVLYLSNKKGDIMTFSPDTKQIKKECNIGHEIKFSPIYYRIGEEELMDDVDDGLTFEYFIKRKQSIFNKLWQHPRVFIHG